MTDLIKKTVADDKFKVFCERLEGLVSMDSILDLDEPETNE